MHGGQPERQPASAGTVGGGAGQQEVEPNTAHAQGLGDRVGHRVLSVRCVAGVEQDGPVGAGRQAEAQPVLGGQGRGTDECDLHAFRRRSLERQRQAQRAPVTGARAEDMLGQPALLEARSRGEPRAVLQRDDDHQVAIDRRALDARPRRLGCGALGLGLVEQRLRQLQLGRPAGRPEDLDVTIEARDQTLELALRASDEPACRRATPGPPHLVAVSREVAGDPVRAVYRAVHQLQQRGHPGEAEEDRLQEHPLPGRLLVPLPGQQQPLA